MKEGTRCYWRAIDLHEVLAFERKAGGCKMWGRHDPSIVSMWSGLNVVEGLEDAE